MLGGVNGNNTILRSQVGNSFWVVFSHFTCYNGMNFSPAAIANFYEQPNSREVAISAQVSKAMSHPTSSTMNSTPPALFSFFQRDCFLPFSCFFLRPHLWKVFFSAGTETMRWEGERSRKEEVAWKVGALKWRAWGGGKRRRSFLRKGGKRATMQKRAV